MVKAIHTACDFHVDESGDLGNVKLGLTCSRGHIVRTNVASMSHPYIFSFI